jgi:hypothetical protein
VCGSNLCRRLYLIVSAACACLLLLKTQQQQRRFKLQPQQFGESVQVQPRGAGCHLFIVVTAF